MSKKDKKDLKNRLVSLYGSSSNQAECFRTIKTNIEMMSIDKKVSTLLVTSPTQDSGKTMLAANLAATYAQCGVKTLLIDLDLRKPSLRYAFTIARMSHGIMGLFDYSQELTLQDVIIQMEESNLYLLPVGRRPVSPHSILNSNRLKQLLQELKEDFEMIIIDTPPVLPVTDALLISKWADASVLMARYGYSNKADIRKALKYLHDANANVVGTIFNNPQMKRSKNYYYAESGTQ